ncbi:hypothetical protein NC651_008898 [Populus alba x Populus x berolinensis]|nr:hypothetical protein NC651_008898 [Populus alba x Populus x berolinensis]
MIKNITGQEQVQGKLNSTLFFKMLPHFLVLNWISCSGFFSFKAAKYVQHNKVGKGTRGTRRSRFGEFEEKNDQWLPAHTNPIGKFWTFGI